MADFEESKDGGVLVLAMSGRLDSGNAKAAEEVLVGLVERGERRIAVDFARLDYISSAGLRVLLLTAKKLQPLGGRLALAALQAHIQEIFAVSGFARIFSIHPARAEAVDSLKS